ncbi:MAG: FHA domain-containing protein [Sedimentisphaerales bacterium]|nr:FHA domain-containing protein [Sedimentisphaerales bacterium]
MPSLHILQGPDKGLNIEITHSPTLLGRNSPDLPLTDNTLSRRHAQLTKRNGSWLLDDLNSANGTYINGVKVSSPMALKQGDQIKCGTTLIVFGGEPTSGIPGEPGGSLRIDPDGNIIESAIMATVPSMEDSVIIAGPEASSAVENLRLLYELSAAISSIFDRRQLLEKVMDIIFDNMPADRGFILLKQPEEGGELSPEVIRYRTREHQQKITVSHTIVNYVRQHKEGVLCSNAMRDPRFAKGKSVHNFGIHSALCVPIMARDQAVGVIYVDTTVATHTYAGDQLRLLTAIGLHTGLAIEHARLYQAGVRAERLAAAGETVAYLSHGIKNILQSLQSAADVVDLGFKKRRIETARQGWTILQRNLTRIQNLVLNMLAFSKPRQPSLEMIQLNQLIGETIEMISSQADEKQIGLITDLDEHLPSIPLDPSGMQQVLLNLILNALDAVKPGKGIITVKTEFDGENQQALLMVNDNGSGIEPKQLKHIFQAFISSKGQGGTGLGLAVVHKIVGEHRGKVSVTSTPGEGTVFTIRLPIAGANLADSSSTTAGPASPKDDTNVT